MRILWDLPLLQQRVPSAALEERAQDSSASAKGVDFALFNIPRIAKCSDARQRPKHGGVAEPLRRISERISTQDEELKRNNQLCDF
jgi:hypothetical protein